MAHIAVVGAGPAGLATSLFLARRGHSVSLLEKDEADPPTAPERCFDDWSRRGVAQAKQPHLLLGRSSQVLQEEAPDLLHAFVAGGANLLTNEMQQVSPGKTEQAFYVCSRRMPLEAVLRRETLKDRGVSLIRGAEVTGLATRPGRDIPTVQGVKLDDGRVLDADLVVDASGRWSPAPRWLQDVGASPASDVWQDCNLCYITRWYRLKPDERFPQARLPVRATSSFAMFMCFPADADTFGLIATVSMHDPVRAQLRDPVIFDRVMNALPTIAPWISRAEPISGPHVLGRIENRSRSLLSEGRPVVSGLALVGDSAAHTNPTMGRGVSLAYLQAQRLAQLADTQDVSTARFALEFERWKAAVLGVWFDTQVAADQGRIIGIERALAGEEPLPPQDAGAKFTAAVMALAGADPAVGRAFTQMSHMLLTPPEMASDAAVQAAVAEYIGAGKPLTAPLNGPSRAEFESLASRAA